MLKKIIRDIVVNSSKYKVLFKFYSYLYGLSIFIELFVFKKIREIDTIYLRHGMVFSDIEPGLSDIDMAVSIKEMPVDKEIKFLEKYVKIVRFLKRIIPLIGEIEIFTKAEFSFWKKKGGLGAFESSSWKLLKGKDEKEKKELKKGVFKVNSINQSLDLFYFQLNDLLLLEKIEGKRYVKAYLKILKAIYYFNQPPESIGSLSKKEIFVKLENKNKFLFDNLNKAYNSIYTDELDSSINISLSHLVISIEDNINRLDYQSEHDTLYSVMNIARNDTYDYVMDILFKPLSEIKKINGIKGWHLIPGRLGDSGAIGNYNYKLYVVLERNFNDRYFDTFTEIRAIVLKYKFIWPTDYFSLCRYPILITEEIFNYAISYWDPTEGIYAKRNNDNISLTDIIELRAQSYFALSRLHIRGYGINKPVNRFRKEDYNSELTLIDYVFTLIHMDFLLNYKIIVLTPSDIVKTYLEQYPADIYKKWIERFYKKYSNLRQEDMKENLNINKLYEEVLPFIKYKQERIMSYWRKY